MAIDRRKFMQLGTASLIAGRAGATMINGRHRARDLGVRIGRMPTGPMNGITDVLNESIYGHDKAKRQIKRVIGQWVTGKQTGYCFGFEGAPGIGKTSLARKGLANCLKD